MVAMPGMGSGPMGPVAMNPWMMPPMYPMQPPMVPLAMIPTPTKGPELAAAPAQATSAAKPTETKVDVGKQHIVIHIHQHDKDKDKKVPQVTFCLLTDLTWLLNSLATAE